MLTPRSTAGALALASILLTPAVASAATADLSVTNPSFDGPRTPGSEGTYTYTASNAGPDAVGALVTDQLATGEELISIAASQGTCSTQDGLSTCEVGTLAPGAAPVTITVRVRIPRAADIQHNVYVNDPSGSMDPNEDNNVGGIGFEVAEPEQEVVETPKARTGEWERTQSTLKVEAELSPHGAGTYYFEYGRTTAYGKRTAIEKISTQKTDVTRRAVIDGLEMKTRYHYRVVLVVDGKAYRGKDHAATTFGKLLYPLITLEATKRTASSTSYKGTVGDGLADAPGACRGTITIEVYTEAGDVMNRRTTVNARTCAYRITIPFGTTDARRYGPKGKGVWVQARFSGTKAVAPTGSDTDRP